MHSCGVADAQMWDKVALKSHTAWPSKLQAACQDASHGHPYGHLTTIYAVVPYTLGENISCIAILGESPSYARSGREDDKHACCFGNVKSDELKRELCERCRMVDARHKNE